MKKKTIYSLPEYKFLDSVVKKHFPNHRLALWWMNVNNSLQLIAAPKYTGYRLSESIPYNEDAEIYSFYTGKFLSCDARIRDKYPNIYHLTQGFQLSLNDRDLLLYMHNPIFKYGISLFKDLFKTATALRWRDDVDDIRFIQINKRSYDYDRRPSAFLAIDSNDFTFEKFMIANDMNSSL